MTGEQFRKLALGMPEAVEGSHMGHPDFRAGKRIFATLTEDEETAVVKLTPEQQEEFMEMHEAFAPAKGGWGRQGYTQVQLAAADAGMVARAVRVAWENVRGR